jgi:capsular exopolysaccharide synthesis family protein
MSRYFNETSRAAKGAAEALTAKLDIKDLLSPVLEGGEEVPRDVEQTAKTSALPRLILPVPEDIPLLTRRDDGLAHAAESYRTLRTRLLRLQASQKIRSVVLSSSLPGEGKTLTTVNLGLCCTQLHKFSVLIVDADFRTRGLTHLLGCNSAVGLSELLSGKVTYAQAVLSTDFSNLSVVSAGAATESPAELFASTKWKDFIEWASDSFKLVLIDSPPVLPLADFELISAGCDGVVFVIRGGSTSREMILRASAQVDSRKLLGSVFNMSRHPTQVDYRGYSGSGLSVKRDYEQEYVSKS